MNETIYSMALNDPATAYVQIDYVGEQTKPVPSIAFSAQWPSAALLGTTPSGLAPKSHLCTGEEMKNLVGVVQQFARGLRAGVQQSPFLTATVKVQRASRDETKSIDRAQTPSFLDAIRDALHELDRPAREAVERFRTQIL